MGKTAGTTQQVSTTGPHPTQAPYLEQGFSAASNLFNNYRPSFFPGETVAPFTETEQEGRAAQLFAARDIRPFLEANALPTLQFGLNAADLESNPVLPAYLEAATRPLYENLTRNILPSIRGGAVATGNLGGTRRGVAEGLAAGETQKAAGDISTNILSNAYNTGLQAQQAALNFVPTYANLLTLPGDIISGVGASERAFNQAQINEQIARHQFEQTLPYQQLAEYMNTVRYPYGGTATSEVVGTPPSNIQQIIGAVLTGLGTIPGIIDLIRGIFGQGSPIPSQVPVGAR